jgi:hypothetical protein
MTNYTKRKHSKLILNHTQNSAHDSTMSLNYVKYLHMQYTGIKENNRNQTNLNKPNLHHQQITKGATPTSRSSSCQSESVNVNDNFCLKMACMNTLRRAQCMWYTPLLRLCYTLLMTWELSQNKVGRFAPCSIIYCFNMENNCLHSWMSQHYWQAQPWIIHS